MVSVTYSALQPSYPTHCLFYCTYIITFRDYEYEVAKTLENIAEEVPAKVHWMRFGVVQHNVEVRYDHPSYEYEQCCKENALENSIPSDVPASCSLHVYVPP